MIRSSTIQLLRFHFSFFLMPVYWFGLASSASICFENALLVFIILHLLIFPASNGYNSYMDRDTSSIGGVKNPKQPTKQLFYVSNVMDITGLLLSSLISIYFFTGILLYILASRAYSSRRIRLKKYPLGGFITVMLFQGAVVYFLAMHGSSCGKGLHVSFSAISGISLLVASFYPLTQIYQHKEDKEDGVKTLSILLGYRGTFLFSGICFITSMMFLGFYFYSIGKVEAFLLMQLFFVPVLVFFFWWFAGVWKDKSLANFTNTMRMNLIGSVCTNAAFIFYLITKHFE